MPMQTIVHLKRKILTKLYNKYFSEIFQILREQQISKLVVIFVSIFQVKLFLIMQCPFSRTKPSMRSQLLENYYLENRSSRMDNKCWRMERKYGSATVSFTVLWISLKQASTSLPTSQEAITSGKWALFLLKLVCISLFLSVVCVFLETMQCILEHMVRRWNSSEIH